ncbi:MAG: hypothetical protein LBC73_07580 [Oscillospiraceae bacterium]|jgi:hypothetical protein|nr:hypothetical protein [Oscillospiraceae bacterium]
MSNSILSIILSSSVVATVIIVFCNWIQNNRKSILERITDERKQWRDDMRTCALKFQREHDLNASKDLLASIKLRINAYGITNENDYLSDGHIWKIITEYEALEEAADIEDAIEPVVVTDEVVIKQKEIKNIIIELLSCLLKNDWERSKSEVLINKYPLICIAISLFFIILSIAPLITTGAYNSKTLSTDTVLILTTVILGVFALIITGCLNYIQLNKRVVDIYSDTFTSKNKKSYAWFKYHVYPQFTNAVVALLGIYIIVSAIIEQIRNGVNNGITVYIGIILIATSFYNGMVLDDYNRKQKQSTKKYFDTIDNILNS